MQKFKQKIPYAFGLGLSFMTTPLWGFRSDLSIFFITGPHLNYGQGYVTLNNPEGLWGLNRSAPGIRNRNFSEPLGISSDLQLRYSFLDRFFFSLGVNYTAGIRNIGQYPLQSPQNSTLLEASGGNFVGAGQGEYIPIRGSFQQSHYGAPLTLGFFINFWQEIRLFAGGGLGLYFGRLRYTQTSTKPALLEYTMQSDFRGFAFTTYYTLMAEYLAVGSPEDVQKLGLIAGFQRIWGRSAPLTDLSISDIPPPGNPAAPAPQVVDSGRINLSGLRLFFGISYYFLSTK
ncbi:MAG: hypothetical protein NZM25_06295 [Leptospiraceae bacterium]|nr:hypothetical protein [Leptospiraceae bacterium]MDW8306614.1 hypothetical protein [Leptospiraceae bacterium]